MHQDGSEDNIFTALWLENQEMMHDTPEEYDTLGKNPDGYPSNDNLNYNYLLVML